MSTPIVRDFLTARRGGVLDAMTATSRRRATALVSAALATVLTGCSLSAGGFDATTPGSSSVTPSAAARVPVVLRFGDRVITASLTDSPESRQLAAMLPATVELRDVWGQAKSGRLPRALTVQSGAPVHDPVPGEIYFWPATEVIAIYYDDLGQTVPDPGLIRLGTVGTGLSDLAAAGKRVTVRMDRDPGTGS